MDSDGIPWPKITRFAVTIVMALIGLWAYMSKKDREAEAARKNQQIEDQKAAEAAAAELKRQREEGFHE